MSRLLRFSRWRRLPGGAHRVFEKRLPTHAETLQRFTVYLSGRIVEHAEALARLEGVAHAQAYCEGILNGVIQAEVARRRVDATPPITPTDQEIEEQADNLARDQGGSAAPRSTFSLRLVDTGTPATTEPGFLALPGPAVNQEAETPEFTTSLSGEPKAAVARAIFLVESRAPHGFLDSLRQGVHPSESSVAELLVSLDEVERELRRSSAIDRRLAHALFRLAFESQVLITDAWPRLGDDLSTLDAVRTIQEAAERVLSGLDVRYDQLANRGGGAPS